MHTITAVTLARANGDTKLNIQAVCNGKDIELHVPVNGYRDVKTAARHAAARQFGTFRNIIEEVAKELPTRY